MSFLEQKEEEGMDTEAGSGAERAGRKKLNWRRWVVENFGWSWFTCTQSTGGVAIALSLCPKPFDGLQTIGAVIFILNLVLFLAFCGLLVTRCVLSPPTLVRSLTQAPECYFFGSFWLTMATIIICMQRFGVPHAGPWLIVAIRVCFWLYASVTILSTTIHFVVLFKYNSGPAIKMNPAWFFLVYNAMLTGTVASAIAMDQPPSQRLPIIVAGISYQGFGWITSMLILSWFLGHLMENGWPPPSKAPGLFITVGSDGFTVVALIGCARALPQDYGYFAAHPIAVEVLQIVATWVGVFMWVFALWLFGLALLVCLTSLFERKDDGTITLPMTFNTTWWALIFPNVGFTIGTIYLGQELESNAVLWVSTIMVILLVAFWLFNLVFMAKAIVMSLVRDDVKVS